MTKNKKLIYILCGAILLLVVLSGLLVHKHYATKQQQVAFSKQQKNAQKKNQKNIQRAPLGYYDSITLGDINSTGKPGAKLQDVKNALGSPDRKESTHYHGIPTKKYYWVKKSDNGQIKIDAEFVNGYCFKKHISGIKVARLYSIDRSDFQALKKNQNFAAVGKILGAPNEKTSYTVNNHFYQIIVFDLGNNSSVTVNFKDDKLINRDESGL